MKILTRAGYLEYTDEQDNASRLMFTIRRDELYRLESKDPDVDKLINVILRSYTGLFTDYAFINEESLALRSGLTRQKIYDILISYSKRHIVHYIPQKKCPYIIYTRERQNADKIILSPDIYEKRKESYEKRIKAMVDYVSSEDNCRSRMLLNYFGEKNRHNCMMCDVCLEKHNSGIKKGEFKDIEDSIKSAIGDSKILATSLFDILEYDKEKIQKVITYLTHEEIIGIKDGYIFILR